MAAQRTTAVYVGIFVIAGILTMMWFSLEVGGSLFGKDRIRVTATFEDVHGLSVGNPVTLRGVEIGRIGALAINDETGVPQVTMLIDSGRDIRDNAIAALVQPVLMGARVIDITYPESGPSGSPLRDGAVLVTEKRMDLLSALSGLGEVTGDVQSLISSIDENQDRAFNAFTSAIEDNRERIDSIVANLDEAVPQMRDAFSSINEVTTSLREGDGTLARLINDAEMADDIRASASQIRSITSRIDSAEGTIWRLMEDEEVYDNLSVTMANFRDASDGFEAMFGEESGLGGLAMDLRDAMPDLRITLANASEITTKINSGEGTIGLLVNQPTLHDDLSGMIRRISETLETAEEQSVIRTFLVVFFGAMS